MSSRTFDRETLLDLTVNAIPLAMILFFVVFFFLFNPFGTDAVASALQFTILAVMFGALALLTYYSGAAISNAEKEMDDGEFEAVSEQVGAGEAAVEDAGDGEQALGAAATPDDEVQPAVTRVDEE